MHITHQEKPTDPVYPIMHGSTPISKEFNKRFKELWKTGNIDVSKLESIYTVVLLEILIEDYNKRHKQAKKVKNNPTKQKI